MSDRTGRKIGSLDAIIYFEREDGYIVLPAFEAGDPSLAHKVFDQRYRNNPNEKWQWREAESLGDVDRLQSRLQAQEERRNSAMLETHHNVRERVRKDVGDSLRQRMVSSSTSPFEREAIGHYLMLRDDVKRDKYRQAIQHTQSYLWAREMDTGTKVIDRMPSQPGEFWRTEQQQRD